METASICMTYLNSGEFLEAIRCSLSHTFPFNMFFVFLGFVLLGVVFQKTKSHAISGIVMILYALSAYTVIDKSFQPYYMLVMGVSIMVLLISIFLGIRRRY